MGVSKTPSYAKRKQRFAIFGSPVSDHIWGPEIGDQNGARIGLKPVHTLTK